MSSRYNLRPRARRDKRRIRPVSQDQLDARRARAKQREDEDQVALADARDMKSEAVFVGNGTIAYSAWMFNSVFGEGGSGPYSVAERPVLLTRVGEGLESCSGACMGLTLYPVRTEQGGRLKRLVHAKPSDDYWEACRMFEEKLIARDDPDGGGEDVDDYEDDDDDIDVCTMGVLETGEEVWPYRDVFFFPIVPTLDRWWPCLPSPALFAAVSRILNARLSDRRREAGQPVESTPLLCPLFYSSRVDVLPKVKEIFLALRDFLGPLYDPLFDTTVEDTGLLGVGAARNVNNFQAGVGVVFLSCDARSLEEKRLAAMELRDEVQSFLDEDLDGGACHVLVARGAVRRRTTFSTSSGFKYTSRFEPSIRDKINSRYVQLLDSESRLVN